METADGAGEERGREKRRTAWFRSEEERLFRVTLFFRPVPCADKVLKSINRHASLRFRHRAISLTPSPLLCQAVRMKLTVRPSRPYCVVRVSALTLPVKLEKPGFTTVNLGRIRLGLPPIAGLLDSSFRPN